MIATIAEAVMDDVTQPLAGVREEDNEALNRLFSIVYDDLHRMARARVARDGPMTLLDPTRTWCGSTRRSKNSKRPGAE